MAPSEIQINRRERRRRQSAIARHMRMPESIDRIKNPDHISYAPEKLSLADGDRHTVEFFIKVRQIANPRASNDVFAVDLKHTKLMDLGAALALVAEFDRWQRLRFGRLLPRTVEEWDPDIREELNHLGFFRLLRTNLPPSLRRSKTKAFIQFVSDTATIGKAASLLSRRLDSELHGSTGYDHQIYVVLVEAMKNAFQHAYPDDRPNAEMNMEIGKRWWMAAAIDRTKRSIEVAFLDLGVTIPHSLPYSWMWEHLPQAARSGTDIDRIVEALKYGRSRLGEPHRGKGFANIMHPATLHANNHVTVLSGKGFCIIFPEEVRGFEIEDRFAGTLIRWKMNLFNDK